MQEKRGHVPAVQSRAVGLGMYRSLSTCLRFSAAALPRWEMSNEAELQTILILYRLAAAPV